MHGDVCRSAHGQDLNAGQEQSGGRVHDVAQRARRGVAVAISMTMYSPGASRLPELGISASTVIVRVWRLAAWQMEVMNPALVLRY